MYHPYLNVVAKQKMKDLRRIAGVSEYGSQVLKPQVNLLGVLVHFIISLFN